MLFEGSHLAVCEKRGQRGPKRGAKGGPKGGAKGAQKRSYPPVNKLFDSGPPDE